MAYTLKKKIRIILWLIAFIIIAAIFLPLISKTREMRALDNLRVDDIKQIEAENQTTQEIIYKLQNDPFYLEKTAREKLGVTRDKEVLYKVVSEPEKRAR